MKKYVFREYETEYETFFKSEKDRLKKIIGNSANIEHVGSTAIPGLGGKGVVDLLIGTSKNKIEHTKIWLLKAGYQFPKNTSTSERLFFRRDCRYKNEKRRIHIHLVEKNGIEWKSITAFRDYLKTHPNAIERYVTVKKDAVKKADGDGEIYRHHKKKFIEDILKKLIN